jgi:Domain of Unknown Function (DUF1080)
MMIHRSDRRPGLLASFGTIRRALQLLSVCVMLITTATATALSAGQTTAPKDPSGGPTGKRVLFDGKTLDGWKKTDFSHPGEVKVEDGRIVMATGQPMTGITTTHQDLPRTNYELTYEAMRTSGEDFFAAATFPVGQSYITLVNGGWSGFVTGLSSLNGMDASENETTRSFRYENKTWYKFRVRVTGEVIRCWVGEKEMVAVEHKEKHVGTRIESRANEPLGFAAWKSGGALRNIEVRPLAPDEIAVTNKIE